MSLPLYFILSHLPRIYSPSNIFFAQCNSVLHIHFRNLYFLNCGSVEVQSRRSPEQLLQWFWPSNHCTPQSQCSCHSHCAPHRQVQDCAFSLTWAGSGLCLQGLQAALCCTHPSAAEATQDKGTQKQLLLGTIDHTTGMALPLFRTAAIRFHGNLLPVQQ